MTWSRLALAVGAWLLPLTCLAAPATGDRTTFEQTTSTYTVEPNGTWAVDAEGVIRAPAVNPSNSARVPLTWSASTEQLEVVEARTDKADGRSIVLGREAIRDDPPVGDEYFHEFSDLRRLVITFPDVEAGDQLVIRTHRDVFRPRVPGGFMTAPVLDRNIDWNETNFTISVPAGLPFHFEARGFDHQAERIKDRMMHYMYSPQSAIPPGEVSVLGEFDRAPRFAASTFRDWDEFGRAYASVLLPHAKVTPAITAMAAKLTEGQQDQREQARLIYEWVRDHVRHIPIPLEESRPEPNDAEQVMTKLYGDDKDHVILLYALLAAREIPAEIVLLNASNSATIADPPNVRPMDHLILFLPTFNLYADTTLRVAPFGDLAFEELGKPAIHLGGAGPPRRTIPMPPPDATWAQLTTDATLGEDGTVSGTTTTTARGAFGIWLRSAARIFGENDQAAAVTLLRQHNTPGTGTFAFDKPTSPGDDFTVRGTFRLQNQSTLMRGGFFAPWTGLRILPRTGDVLGGPMFVPGLSSTEPTLCYPGNDREDISLTLPPGRKLGGLPPDATIDNELVHYRSHWSLDGQRVSVSREFRSLVPGLVCQGKAREDMADALTKIRADLFNPIGIRKDEMPAPSDTDPDAPK